jgi:hypothetical protein
MYRLFSWELSYFSGKVRAYLRYKEADRETNGSFLGLTLTGIRSP